LYSILFVRYNLLVFIDFRIPIKFGTTRIDHTKNHHHTKLMIDWCKPYTSVTRLLFY